jgi:hypothetical protein
VIEQLDSTDLSSLPKLIKSHKQGLTKAGLKIGPRSKVLGLLRTVFLPGKDPVVAGKLGEAGLGTCRFLCADQELDQAALVELGREWKLSLINGESSLGDDLRALEMEPGTMKAAAFGSLVVATADESAAAILMTF